MLILSFIGNTETTKCDTPLKYVNINFDRNYFYTATYSIIN